jgi:hypothetical protein
VAVGERAKAKARQRNSSDYTGQREEKANATKTTHTPVDKDVGLAVGPQDAKPQKTNQNNDLTEILADGAGLETNSLGGEKLSSWNDCGNPLSRSTTHDCATSRQAEIGLATISSFRATS